MGMTDVACLAATTGRDNDINLEPDDLGCDLGKALGVSLGPPILDCDRATLDPAEFTQPPHECVDPCALARRRAAAEESDGRQFGRLLRARHERPRGRRAAKQRHELAPFHCQCLPRFRPKG
jgi:hypothetical protein